MLSDSDRILVDRRWLVNDRYRENNLSFHREGKRRIVDDIRWRKPLSDYSGQIGISYATEIVEEMLKIDLRRLSILEISEIVGEGIREFLEKLKELSSCWKRRGLWIISWYGFFCINKIRNLIINWFSNNETCKMDGRERLWIYLSQ